MTRAAWFVLAGALAAPTACAGRSTSLDSEKGSGGAGNTGGNGGSGGRTTGAGASGAVGGTVSGATGSGATGATGSGATGATGSGATGSGATGGVVATGGAAGSAGMTSCDEPDLDDRRCLIDTDCRVSAPRACCGPVRIHGVAKAAGCVEDPVACIGVCAEPQWITDTMETATDVSVVQVRCEIGEPGAGVCVSYIDADVSPPPTYCDGELCLPTEACVHYAAPGGPAPRCEPLFDGGMCPPGHKLTMCPQSGSLGCMDERAPPPPRCVDVGAACKDPIDCECLPADICGGPPTRCSGVMGRDVVCVDLSP